MEIKMTKYHDLYTPHCWVIVKINSSNDMLYKVLASWYGGFAGSDEWRLNSGISSYEIVREHGDVFYLFKGYSGSVYKVHPNNETFSGLSRSVFDNLKRQSEVSDYTVEHISFEDFVKEFKNDL